MSAMVVLALVAFVLSSYLTWTTWQSESVVGCTGAAVDCDAVLSSHWSKWLGLPVSLFGLLTYAIILGIAWPAAKRPQSIVGTILLTLALLAAGAAIWFVMVQMVFIKSFCPYCMGVHTCGILIAVLTVLLIRNSADTHVDYNQMGALLGVRDTNAPVQANGSQAANGFHPIIATCVACVGLMVLMGGQFLFVPSTLMVELSDAPESETPVATESEEGLLEEEPAEEFSFSESSENSTPEQQPADESTATQTDGTTGRMISVEGLAHPIDLTQYPVIGNPDADIVFVEMLDYTCKHCRHMHTFIHDTLERYDGQLGIIIYHIPLSKKCNPHVEKDGIGKKYACDYARLAMGVARLAPKEFPEFHDWLMDGERPPSPGQVRRRALALAGEEVLINETIQSETLQRITEHCNIFHEAKAGLPMVLTNRGVIKGIPKESEQWFQVMEQFGLKLVAETPATTP